MTCSASEIPYMVVFQLQPSAAACVCVHAYLMHAISYCYISMSALLTWCMHNTYYTAHVN